MLRSDKLRGYRIDIETDSTVFEDEAALKEQTVEVMTAVGTFMREALPVVQAVPELSPLAFEMLEMGVRQLKRGRALEDVIEQAKQAILQKVAQAQQQRSSRKRRRPIEAMLSRRGRPPSRRRRRWRWRQEMQVAAGAGAEVLSQAARLQEARAQWQTTLREVGATVPLRSQKAPDAWPPRADRPTRPACAISDIAPFMTQDGTADHVARALRDYERLNGVRQVGTDWTGSERPRSGIGIWRGKRRRGDARLFQSAGSACAASELWMARVMPPPQAAHS